MAAKNEEKGAEAKAEYKRTPREDEAVGKLMDAFATSSPQVRIEGGRVLPNHPHEPTGLALLMEALGTEDLAFVQGLLVQLANAGPGNDLDAVDVNFLLAMVKGVKPKDQVEAMLAAQMAVVHVATMTFARHLANAKNVIQVDSTGRTFNKLMQTFTAQMEALKRYRSGGEQKVTVQHVNVSEGGQAIVGNVTQGRRRDAAISDAKPVSMPIVETPHAAKVPTGRTPKK